MKKSAALLSLCCAALLVGCGAAEEAAEGDARVRPAGAVAEPAHVVAAIARLSEFARMTQALESSGVGAELEGLRAVTLLAPRDTAFAELTVARANALLAPPNADMLRGVLRGLAIPTMLRAGELRTQIDAAGGTLQLRAIDGSTLSFSHEGEMLMVSNGAGARATMGSLELSAGNGVVYVLDAWIGPVPAPLPVAAPPATAAPQAPPVGAVTPTPGAD